MNLAHPDDRRYERHVDGLKDPIGRAPSPISGRGRRYPSRADLLRAMLTVTEENPDMLEHVRTQLRRDLFTDETITQLHDAAGELRRLVADLDPKAREPGDHLAGDLDNVAAEADLFGGSRDEASQLLAAAAVGVETLGAPPSDRWPAMRDLAAHIRAVRNVVDPLGPDQAVQCPGCRLAVRLDPEAGEAEYHRNWAGQPCSGTAR